MPHSEEAEAAVLGFVLLRGLDGFVELADLREQHFHNPRYRAVWRAILALAEGQQPIDTVTVEHQLRLHDERKVAGGLPELTRLLDQAQIVNLRHHAQRLRDLAALRNLIDVALSIADAATGPIGSVPEFLSDAEQRLLAACEQRTHRVDIDADSIVKNVFVDLRRRAKGEIVNVNTGLRDFDKLTGGLEAGDLWIIAGRPGSGKTALVMSILQNLTIERPSGRPAVPTLVFSLEMPHLQLGQRMLAAEARVDLLALRTAQLGADEWEQLVRVAPNVARAAFRVDDTGALPILELKARARLWRRRCAAAPIGLIIVDYLQLARGSGNHDRRDLELGEISGGLKALAKEIRCPVIALSQLNRDCEKRAGGRPQISDLRESGSIEQDADGVVLVWREEKHLPPDAPASRVQAVKGLATLIVAKQRNGPTRDVLCLYQERWARFENFERVKTEGA